MRTTRSCTARRERQAREVLAALTAPDEEVGLRLHPAKTKIVYCKDAHAARLARAHVVHVPGVRRSGPPGARRRATEVLVRPSSLPAVSPDALKKIRPAGAPGGCTRGPGTT